MKVAIAGSRNITDYWLLKEAIDNAASRSGIHITSVISGGARGVDTLGEIWAWIHDIPYTEYPALWDFYGRRAGHVRTLEMIADSEACVIVWDGDSKGTSFTIECCLKQKVSTYIYNTRSF